MPNSSYLFESASALTERLSYVIESKKTTISASWNTPQLDLPLTASAIFKVELSQDDPLITASALELSPELRGRLTLSFGPSLREHHHSVRLQDCPQLIAEGFDLNPERLEPRMLWRAQEATWCVVLSQKDSAQATGEAREARLSVVSDVSYHLASNGLKLAEEPELRVEVLRGTHQPLLSQLLRERPHLPAVSCYWMSEYHYKRLYRLPTHQDLPEYEYEAKLSAAHLNVHELPKALRERFEIIERYQTESVRWYVRNLEAEGLGRIKKGRVGFRGPRASLVMKGEKEKLKGGILKRREEKSQGLNTWELSSVAAEAKEMRRIKRQLYICSKESARVYALCLDHCYVSASAPPLLQVELEYNGRLLVKPQAWSLNLSAQLELASSLMSEAPKVAGRCLERASLLAQLPSATEEQRAELERLEAEWREVWLAQQPQQLDLSELSEVGLAVNTQVDPQLEAEVLDEMRLILTSLRERFGFSKSSKTKRAWLKDTLKSTVDLEPLL